ncbi:TrmH family RNA methyltransferase [Leucobacter chromiireducens]|uniref:TrmH family RNA methyltransferase n=1 Tax=Leucobacter chromiireducens TaxID=283877 RepID=UPI000F6338EE|nr:TrmH family RNA methyltransferase [Leucobacter chromiireducens]
MTPGTLLDKAYAPALPAEVIENARHPAVRRVADVLRSRTSRARTILIDDEENIVQAVRAGVQILTLYCSAELYEYTSRRQLVGSATDVRVLSDEVVRGLFTGEKQSRMFALARAPKAASWRNLSSAHGDLLVLDGVRIPGNIGAILRSACAFGSAGVVLLESGLTSIYDRRLIRASRGLVFTIPVLTSTRDDLAEFLQAERIPLAALTADATDSLEAINQVPARVAILMGSERTGPSDALHAQATYRYGVPMMPGVESLNVSVAAGIALHERHRRSGERDRGAPESTEG